MKVLHGTVFSGLGAAANNLGGVLGLLRERTGMAGLVAGSLNLRLDEPYVVCPDARLSRAEYWNVEDLLLQRCRIQGLRAWIARPASHQSGAAHGTGVIEVMAECQLRMALGLFDRDRATVEVEGDEAWWRRPPAPGAPRA